MKFFLLFLMFLYNNLSFAMQHQTQELTKSSQVKEGVTRVKKKKRCSLKDVLCASAIFAGGFAFHSLISSSGKNQPQPEDSSKSEQSPKMARHGTPCDAFGKAGSHPGCFEGASVFM